ncbi:triphosphoribosyl-dephospho-CoA synthase [Mesoplasma lactucae]|uniref:triphosphoribosyl-dephospho-CoA synthase n=1 Tax=Mesoplasma lactucae ATCC 49193 TaxID=81460 RepID=A0A291ISL2_9MOLU|nr:triphosphoribosyl-dephospho-CoA synthase [Mesoplasma lactucae]ATG97750.1 hypothetical protein CP520_03370 [Mesoplasma lactucae ATCC 49193]ATZ20473.1 triphosphoribosyl-dephospho-CoA synthase [Mesoplasma lactucae ATCC 49193]MCL8216645.1 2-(5''-triphosphoribosyl)-3'-dephosphocoenzyme-A synthase [Mesoplasma lactucae ATCC 49193]
MNKSIYYKSALKAVKSEMDSYPSLGLVSKQNSGSHSDMSIKDFEKSYEIFPKYLTDITNNLDEIHSFDDLRKIGYRYEQEMFKATNNINTHKGLIFCLGIFYYSLLKNKKKSEIIPEIKEFCKPLLNELANNPANSIGLKLYKQNKISGARQTALSGYDIVFKAYDFYKQFIEPQHLKENENNFIILIYLLIHIQDTTLINKIGLKEYMDVEAKFAKLLTFMKKDYRSCEQEVYELNTWAINNNISPGGCADLLVLVDTLIFSDF